MKNFWLILGGICAVAAIILSIFTFSYGEIGKRKELKVTLVSRTSLVNNEFGYKKGEIKVTYDGEDIGNYSLLQLKVENSGRQPIRKEDFSQPIEIKLQGNNQIIIAEKIRSDPEELKIMTNISESTVKIDNILFNPTDWYILEVGVVSDSNSLPDVEDVLARISGIKKVEYYSDLKAASHVTTKNIMSIIASLSALSAGFIFGWQRLRMKKQYKHELTEVIDKFKYKYPVVQEYGTGDKIDSDYYFDKLSKQLSDTLINEINKPEKHSSK